MGAGWEKAVCQRETRLWVSFKEKNLVLHIIRFLIRFIYFIYLLAAMTYNQVHYFQVNHLADFTQNGHTKTPVG